MQALKALVAEKPVPDLQAALPSWAFLFGRLVMDGHRGVRAEACHVTAALAAAVGRGIAPLLKALLPPLWLAQFDGYPEAAAAARGALAAAFPAAAKQREAVLFCRAEVGGAVLGNASEEAAAWCRVHAAAICLHNHAAALPTACCCCRTCKPAALYCTGWAMRNHRFCARALTAAAAGGGGLPLLPLGAARTAAARPAAAATAGSASPP